MVDRPAGMHFVYSVHCSQYRCLFYVSQFIYCSGLVVKRLFDIVVLNVRFVWAYARVGRGIWVGSE